LEQPGRWRSGWQACGISAVGVMLIIVSAHGATIERDYRWQYLDRWWDLTHSFSAEHYQFFRTRPRVTLYTEYATYVSDPRDDEQLALLITKLEQIAVAAGLTPWESLNLIIAFLQSFTYAVEEKEYPRYPIETLIDGRGDCEDFAILAAAILRQMGFDVVLLAYTAERHFAIGLRVTLPDTAECQAYEWAGDTYYYVETTSTGWEIGEIPRDFVSRPHIINVVSVFP
jgi:hypothetical protein